MMLRTCDTHIRLGHFEWINQFQPDLLQEITQKCIEWHYPECLETEQPVLSFATQVIQTHICDHDRQVATDRFCPWGYEH